MTFALVGIAAVVFSILFGVVHTDAQGQWIEWFFRKTYAGKRG